MSEIICYKVVREFDGELLSAKVREDLFIFDFKKIKQKIKEIKGIILLKYVPNEYTYPVFGPIFAFRNYTTALDFKDLIGGPLQLWECIGEEAPEFIDSYLVSCDSSIDTFKNCWTDNKTAWLYPYLGTVYLKSCKLIKEIRF